MYCFCQNHKETISALTQPGYVCKQRLGFPEILRRMNVETPLMLASACNFARTKKNFKTYRLLWHILSRRTFEGACWICGSLETFHTHIHEESWATKSTLRTPCSIHCWKQGKSWASKMRSNDFTRCLTAEKGKMRPIFNPTTRHIQKVKDWIYKKIVIL